MVTLLDSCHVRSEATEMGHLPGGHRVRISLRQRQRSVHSDGYAVDTRRGTTVTPLADIHTHTSTLFLFYSVVSKVFGRAALPQVTPEAIEERQVSHALTGYNTRAASTPSLKHR